MSETRGNIVHQQQHETEFRRDLAAAINRASRENGSNTPDFILADYLAGCLEIFDRASRHRHCVRPDRWTNIFCRPMPRIWNA